MGVLVLDAALALDLVKADPTREQLAQIKMRIEAHGALVPLTFRIDVVDHLRAMVQIGMLKIEESGPLLEAVEALNLQYVAFEGVKIGKELIGCGVQTDLSAAKASYIWLAVNQQLPLATTDKRLRKGAEALGGTVVPEGAERARGRTTVH